MYKSGYNPCPFCGSRKISLEIVSYHNDNYFNEKGNIKSKLPTYIIKCNDCYSQTGEYENVLQALKSWNRRTNNV